MCDMMRALNTLLRPKIERDIFLSRLNKKISGKSQPSCSQYWGWRTNWKSATPQVISPVQHAQYEEWVECQYFSLSSQIHKKIIPFVFFAVRIGDISLSLAQAHLTLALACLLHIFSCTKCVAQIAELENTFQHWVQSQPLSAKLIRHDFPPSISCNFPEMPLHLLWTHLRHYTKDWIATNSLPANTTWMYSRILNLTHAHLTPHDLCLTSIHS